MATTIQTFDSVNHEDLSDVLKVVATTDTPFMSNIKTVKVKNPIADWTKFELTTGADDSGLVEGADFSLVKGTTPSRETNYCQTFHKIASVSEDEITADPAGVGNMLAWRVARNAEAMATSMEKAFLQGTGASGGTGTARKLKGALAYITSNKVTGTGDSVTKAQFNSLLEKIANKNGVNNLTAFVDSTQKRAVSSFVVSNDRNIQASEKKLIDSIGVFDSDFGLVKVMFDRFMPSKQVLVANMEYWGNGVFRPYNVKDYAHTFDGQAKVATASHTLISYNEAASGKIVLS